MSLEIARRAEIAPFYVMEMMRAAAKREAAGGEVLHLEVGQPATPAPRAVREAAHRAIDDEVLGYTVALGLDPLRSAIADHYTRTHGIELDPAHVVVTQGASGAFVLSFLACFDAGDRVAVPTPGYPCYRNMLAALDVTVVDVPTDADTRFQPTPELLEAHLPLDGLVVASPSNPSGTMLDPGALEALTGWCEANGVRLISDEIYHGITYEQAAPTAVGRAPSTVVVNSFSKYFSMTGWRLGWMVLPDALLTPVERLAQNFTISASTIAQHAALAAFEALDECEANVARYAENRRILLEGLPAAGFDRLAPADGAFYVYADVTDHTDDSLALCARWLDELGICATPGVDFDPDRGHRFVRFSFAGSAHDIAEAVRRLAG